MTRDVYVQVLADLLSKDPKRVRAANSELFTACVLPNGDSAGHHASLALVDAEQLVSSST